MERSIETTQMLDSALNTIWDALVAYRENLIPEEYEDPVYESEWNSLTRALHLIDSELGLTPVAVSEDQLSLF